MPAIETDRTFFLSSRRTHDDDIDSTGHTRSQRCPDRAGRPVTCVGVLQLDAQTGCPGELTGSGADTGVGPDPLPDGQPRGSGRNGPRGDGVRQARAGLPGHPGSYRPDAAGSLFGNLRRRRQRRLRCRAAQWLDGRRQPADLQTGDRGQHRCTVRPLRLCRAGLRPHAEGGLHHGLGQGHRATAQPGVRPDRRRHGRQCPLVAAGRQVCGSGLSGHRRRRICQGAPAPGGDHRSGCAPGHHLEPEQAGDQPRSQGTGTLSHPDGGLRRDPRGLPSHHDRRRGQWPKVSGDARGRRCHGAGLRLPPIA